MYHVHITAKSEPPRNVRSYATKKHDGLPNESVGTKRSDDSAIVGDDSDERRLTAAHHGRVNAKQNPQPVTARLEAAVMVAYVESGAPRCALAKLTVSSARSGTLLALEH